MTFTVDRLSLLVWVWTVQSLRSFLWPKASLCTPTWAQRFCFFNSSSSSSPISLCFTNRSTKICHYMEFSSSAWNTHSLFAALYRRCPQRQSRDSSLIRRWWQCRHIQQQHITASPTRCTAVKTEGCSCPPWYVKLLLHPHIWYTVFPSPAGRTERRDKHDKKESNFSQFKTFYWNTLQLEHLPSD